LLNISGAYLHAGVHRARQAAAQAKLSSAAVSGQPVGAATAPRLSTDSSTNN